MTTPAQHLQHLQHQQGKQAQPAAGPAPSLILYLHGFRSAPESSKARMLAQALRERGLEHLWHCPQLPASPAQAWALAEDIIARSNTQDIVIIGSSLGGYYATCLAERHQCRAVVLNPVVHAARDLATQVGEHTAYHSDAPFVFLPGYVDELARMAAPRPADPQRYYLLAATGDEVLDWREMADWYRGSQGQIIEGSDHGLSDFARWLPQVLAFVLREA